MNTFPTPKSIKWAHNEVIPWFNLLGCIAHHACFLAVAALLNDIMSSFSEPSDNSAYSPRCIIISEGSN